MHLYINLIFVMLFIIILINVQRKKNLELAQNAIIGFILIMLIKVFLWGYEIYKGEDEGGPHTSAGCIGLDGGFAQQQDLEAQG